MLFTGRCCCIRRSYLFPIPHYDLRTIGLRAVFPIHCLPLLFFNYSLKIGVFEAEIVYFVSFLALFFFLYSTPKPGKKSPPRDFFVRRFYLRSGVERGGPPWEKALYGGFPWLFCQFCGGKSPQTKKWTFCRGGHCAGYQWHSGRHHAFCACLTSSCPRHIPAYFIPGAAASRAYRTSCKSFLNKRIPDGFHSFLLL